MNEKLRQCLLAMAKHDHDTREKLVESGELFDPKYGYHPEMKKVHEENNHQIGLIIAEFGWPGFSLVGEDGCLAAGIIVQHAVLEPILQEQCVALLEAAVKNNETYAWMHALLLDRVLTQKGELQIYGSQHHQDQTGKSVAMPMIDPDNVDKRRATVGLPPLQQRTAEIQAEEMRSKHVKNKSNL